MTDKILFGRFEIKRTIGQGGMGTVFLVKEIQTEQLYALKKVSLKGRNKKNILREPKLLSKLDHPGIIKIKEIYETSEDIFIVMDYAKGISLKEALKKEKFFKEKKVVDLAIMLCSILEYLHNFEPNPIIYRDIKPSNIIIDEDLNITLIDFGIACEYLEGVYEDGQIALTRGYCAPEQYEYKIFDQKSDIYSLGITMYQLLTGISPNDYSFSETKIRKFKENISQELEYIINKSIKQNPDDRYQCVEDMKYDFLNIENVEKKLKKITKKQIFIYAILLVMYIFFFTLTIIGYNKIVSETQNTSFKLYEEGYNFLGANNFNKAYENFEKGIKLNINSVSNYKGIFEYYLKSGKYKSGINYIKANEEKLLKIDGLKDVYEYYLGMYYFKENNYIIANNYFQEIYKKDPLNLDSFYFMTLCTIEIKEFALAEKFINDLKNQNYYEYRLKYLMAELSRVTGKFEEANTYYIDIIENADNANLKIDASISKAKMHKNNLDIWPDGINQFFIILEKADKEIINNNIEIISLKAKSYNEYSKEFDEENKKKLLMLSLENYLKILSFGIDDFENYKTISDIYKSLAVLNDDIKYFDLAIKTLTEATVKYTNDFYSNYYLTIALYEKEFFNNDISNSDFNKAKASFNKTKQLAVDSYQKESIKKLNEQIENFNIKK